MQMLAMPFDYIGYSADASSAAYMPQAGLLSPAYRRHMSFTSKAFNYLRLPRHARRLVIRAFDVLCWVWF